MGKDSKMIKPAMALTLISGLAEGMPDQKPFRCLSGAFVRVEGGCRCV